MSVLIIINIIVSDQNALDVKQKELCLLETIPKCLLQQGKLF